MASRPSEFDFWKRISIRTWTNVTWPAGLQSLTFGPILFQSEPGQCDMASKAFKVWLLVSKLQSEPGQRDMATRPSKFDFWLFFRSEPGQRDMASRPSKFDFWWGFRSEPGQRDMASRPSKFDFWFQVSIRALDKVTWPAGLQRLTFGENGSIRAWITWHGQQAFNVWLLVRMVQSEPG